MTEYLELPGEQLLERLVEIWPNEAPDRIQPVYDDLRTALRIPDVPFPFRVLANWPPYLAFAVRQFSPFVRSLAFEAAAETLRTAAARSLAATLRSEQFARARAYVLREHELLPKILLMLTAFAVGLRGRHTESAPPLGTTLPEEEPVPVRPAELPRMIDERVPPLPDIRTLPDAVRAALEELAALRSVPAVDDFSRALGGDRPGGSRTARAAASGSGSDGERAARDDRPAGRPTRPALYPARRQSPAGLHGADGRPASYSGQLSRHSRPSRARR